MVPIRSLYFRSISLSTKTPPSSLSPYGSNIYISLLSCRFGKTLFFEQPLTNPFGHEERFLLSLEDSELRLVTAFDEWLHLRQHCRVCVGVLGSDPVEAEMFDKDGYGNIQVALLPHETLYLPFTFMSLEPYVSKEKKLKKRRGDRNTRSGSGSGSGEGKSSDGHRGEGKRQEREDESYGEGDDEEEEASRVAEVRVVSCTHGHVVAVMRINICPRPSVVHRTLRFFEPENGLMRRRIQLKGGGGGVYPGDPTAVNKFVHCVEMEGEASDIVSGAWNSKNTHAQSKVVVEWGPFGSAGSSAGALDILLRYRCGAFPSLGTFFLLIYDDPYQSQLHEVQGALYSALLYSPLLCSVLHAVQLHRVV
jgi:hypothetical protein